MTKREMAERIKQLEEQNAKLVQALMDMARSAHPAPPPIIPEPLRVAPFIVEPPTWPVRRLGPYEVDPYRLEVICNGGVQ